VSNLKATIAAGIRCSKDRLKDRTQGSKRKRKVDKMRRGRGKMRVLCQWLFECTVNNIDVITQCGKEKEKKKRRERKEKLHDRYIFHKISRRPQATVNRPLIVEILCGAWHVFILTGKSLIVAAMGNRRWTAVDRYSYRDKTTSEDYGHVLTIHLTHGSQFFGNSSHTAHSYLFSITEILHDIKKRPPLEAWDTEFIFKC